ncbi:MAG: DNA repair protein RecO [Pseudomonadota bacterium]
MVEWTGSGVILSARKHGETSVILDVFTEERGRHAGIVRGGASRKRAAELQPGTQVEVNWRARLDEHLGSYTVEPLKSRASIMADRLGLYALGSVTSLIGFAFPERMALPNLYFATLDLLDRLADGRSWLSDYAKWEMTVLEDLGYGLDFSACAATGGTDDLCYVSPKTGRAVSRAGGADYADRLLPLPDFLLGGDLRGLQDIKDSLRLTGFFLNAWLAPALGKAELPEPRARLVAQIERLDDAKI